MRLLLMGLLVFLTACATPAPTFRDHMDADEIYDRLNYKGKKDTVRLLRDQLAMDYRNGQSDPGYAIRTADIVVPVWVAGRTHPQTGEKIVGHWKYLVTQESSWVD